MRGGSVSHVRGFVRGAAVQACSLFDQHCCTEGEAEFAVPRRFPAAPADNQAISAVRHSSKRSSINAGRADLGKLQCEHDNAAACCSMF